MFVFIVLQLLWIMHWRKTSRPDESAVSYRTFQLTLLGGFGAAAAVTVAILAPMGYFGPVSSRVRGLFIRHTHTGNPLVDSVAEHQATQDGMYYQFFHSACYLAPLAVPSLLWKRSDAKHFILVYALVALYFSRKMNRLVLLLSPAASVLAGIAVAGLYEWSILQFWELSDMVTKILTKKVKKEQKEESSGPSAATSSTVPSSVTDKTPSSVAPQKEKDGKKKDKKKGTTPSGTSIAGASTTSSSSVSDSSLLGSLKNIVNIVHEKIMQFYNKFTLLRAILAGGCIYLLTAQVRGFWAHSTRMAVMLSNPSIILQGQTQDGRTVMLDDFREAYWWIRDHTPEDSRVMSW
jgi:dolichyl-diphosphooligosaccharide--protein glycosyltransferase